MQIQEIQIYSGGPEASEAQAERCQLSDGYKPLYSVCFPRTKVSVLSLLYLQVDQLQLHVKLILGAFHRITQ